MATIEPTEFSKFENFSNVAEMYLKNHLKLSGKRLIGYYSDRMTEIA